MSEYYLYAVTVACPVCHEVSQFVVTAENPVPVDLDLSVDKSHCPDCGVDISSVGEWDLRSEHAIDTVGEHSNE